MSVIDQFGNFVDVWKEMWNDFCGNIDCTLEWQYQQAMEYLNNKYLSYPTSLLPVDDSALLEEIVYQESFAKQYVDEILSHEPGTPCSLVYNIDGDMVGGYNANGELCSIGNLVL